jgi:hypothetical protein
MLYRPNSAWDPLSPSPRGYFLKRMCASLPASACQNDWYVQTSEHYKRKSLQAVYFAAVI